MRIAVNTRFLLPGKLEGYGNFTNEIFFRLAASHPEHQFYFLFDRPYSNSIVFPANVMPVVLRPKARHFLAFKWWFDVSVRMALRKYKIDVFVSPDGFCSLTTRVPQVLVVHDLAFLHFPKFISKLHLLYYKTYTRKFIEKARVVATVSNFSQQDILQQYGVDAGKIINVYSAARQSFKPIEWEHREEVKEKYAQGCEYFVFVGGIHPRKNLMNLIKAFSLFKKRQQTNMKLLVVGRLAWDYDKLLEKLKTYKFRNDLFMLGYVENNELEKVVAAAYGLIYPGWFEGFGVPILEAMQCGVPVITSNTSSMPEVAGGAALLIDPANEVDIADKMKLLYKDEPLRTRLVKDGYEVAKQYSWQRSAELMWQAIQQAISK